MSGQTAVVTSGRRGATRVGMALMLEGALGVLGGFASAASAAVSCGSTISTAGSYALGADCSGAGITITASDVTLSLNGHTMTGTGGGEGVLSTTPGDAISAA